MSDIVGFLMMWLNFTLLSDFRADPLSNTQVEFADIEAAHFYLAI